MSENLLKVILHGGKPKRIPFVPTIYDHAAKITGVTPSQLAIDEDLLVKAQLACYKEYKHDLISMGVDIYNVEAEAIGAKVNYYDNEDLPAIIENIIKLPSDLKNLTVPNPAKDGRMPMMIRATKRIADEIGENVTISSSIVGPFTLAVMLRGFENLISDILFEPEFAEDIFSFCKRVTISYAENFIRDNVIITMNESYITPPLLSPAMYLESAAPHQRAVINSLKEKGATCVSLISGGNTTPIVESMLSTGTSLIMADYHANLEVYKNHCKKNNVILRASIESKTLENGNHDEIELQTNKIITACRDYDKFIFGCGIVSYNTNPDTVLELRKIVYNHSI